MMPPPRVDTRPKGSMKYMPGSLHTPSPRKKRVTGYKHLAPTPKKTGVVSSGGGTGNSHGTMIKVGRKRKGFSMPRPDRHGYY